jgi:hypothetical protein
MTGAPSLGHALRRVPRPYKGELLSGAIARAAPYVLGWSPKRLTASMFGTRGALAIPDLPSRLGAFMERATQAWGLTVDDVARRHTAIAYHLHFRGAEAYGQALQALNGTDASLHQRLGVCASVVRGTTHYRLCAACVASDMRSHGETYWRRCQQLPGVLVCLEHEVPLHESRIPFRPPARHLFVAASPAALEDAIIYVLPDGREFEVALDLARVSEHVASSTPAAIEGSQDLRRGMHALGYASAHGGLARLINDFAAETGGPLVAMLFKPRRTGAELGWLADMLHGPRRHLHPLQRILIERFLETRFGNPATRPEESAGSRVWGMYKWRQFIRERREALSDPEFNVRAVARKLSIDAKTVKPLPAPLLPPARNPIASPRPDRIAWLALFEENAGKSKTQLRARSPALYSRLYRNDRAWLLEQRAARVARPRAATVDWATRDRVLAERVQAMVAAVLAEAPLRRASRHFVLGQLRARALIAHYGHHLPLACAALEEGCETVETFQLRRIANVDKTGSLHGSSAPDWRVLRAARINPARYPDGARALLERARKAGRV